MRKSLHAALRSAAVHGFQLVLGPPSGHPPFETCVELDHLCWALCSAVPEASLGAARRAGDKNRAEEGLLISIGGPRTPPVAPAGGGWLLPLAACTANCPSLEAVDSVAACADHIDRGRKLRIPAAHPLWRPCSAGDRGPRDIKGSKARASISRGLNTCDRRIMVDVARGATALALSTLSLL